VQLRPIVVAAGAVRVRSGIQWSLDIPLTTIEHIEFGRVRAPAKRAPGYLRAALGQPNVLIELREPVRALGPYGIAREVRRVGLVIDDLSGFRSAIESTVA